MDPDRAKLVVYARNAAAKGDDLYTLLGIDASAAKEGVNRAWRCAARKYHPDKAGGSYDADKFESLSQARKVLVDPAARVAYADGLKAALQKHKRDKAFQTRLNPSYNSTTRYDAYGSPSSSTLPDSGRKAPSMASTDSETRWTKAPCGQ